MSVWHRITGRTPDEVYDVTLTDVLIDGVALDGCILLTAEEAKEAELRVRSGASFPGLDTPRLLNLLEVAALLTPEQP